MPSLGRRPLHRIVADAPGAAAALHHLLGELPELLMAAVVATGSGRVVASYTSQPDLWPAAAASCWTAMVQQQASQAAQSQGDEQLEEILTTLPTQLHLLRLRPDGQQLLYLAVDAHDTNLALARELMRQAIVLLITT
ncbi:MAG: hypothetical protein EOO56_11170 [Hymenobacter sp.]|nr:MAG: hypothetical protein EOO56_11170 [Hymenobacter sp.]